jgi:hypothetical protein
VPLALKLQDAIFIEPFAIAMPLPVLPVSIVTHNPTIVPVNPIPVPVALLVLTVVTKVIDFVLKIIFATAVFLVVFPATFIRNKSIVVVLNAMTRPRAIIIMTVILQETFFVVKLASALEPPFHKLPFERQAAIRVKLFAEPMNQVGFPLPFVILRAIFSVLDPLAVSSIIHPVAMVD